MDQTNKLQINNNFALCPGSLGGKTSCYCITRVSLLFAHLWLYSVGHYNTGNISSTFHAPRTTLHTIHQTPYTTDVTTPRATLHTLLWVQYVLHNFLVGTVLADPGLKLILLCLTQYLSPPSWCTCGGCMVDDSTWDMYSSMYSSTGNSMYVLCARTFNYKKMVARASGSIQIHIIYTLHICIHINAYVRLCKGCVHCFWL